MSTEIDWGSEFSWGGGGAAVSTEDVNNAVNSYLTNNPVSVTDGSITAKKLDASISKSITDSAKAVTDMTKDASTDYDTFKEVGDAIEGIKTDYAKKTDIPESPDLTDYAKKTDLPDVTNFVEKVDGKGLSTNDYDAAAVAEVAKIADKVDKVDGKGLSTVDFTDTNYVHTDNNYDAAAVAEVAKIKDKVEWVEEDGEHYIKRPDGSEVIGSDGNVYLRHDLHNGWLAEWVNSKQDKLTAGDNIAIESKDNNLVISAEVPDLSEYAKKTDIPEDLDLSEYAKKTDIPEDLDLSEYEKTSAVNTKLESKVDIVTGKGLSTNDYDNDAVAEVAKIKDKAEATHSHTTSDITNFPTSMPASDVSDWAKADTKPSYDYSEITGTPAIPTNTNQLTNGAGYITGITKSDVTTALGYTPPTSDTNTTYSAGTGLSLSGTTFSAKYGSASGTACQGNDSRLSDSRKASDVYSWAKASSKPSYSISEITNAGTQVTYSLSGTTLTITTK